MITKLKLNIILANLYVLKVFLNNLNMTQLMMTKGTNVKSELKIRKNKLASPVKTRLVYF